MGSVYVRLPIACPVCKELTLVPFRIEAILDALELGRSMRLTAPCHDSAWYASAEEISEIRDYLTNTLHFTSISSPWLKR
jgi:hypothetical protein